MIHPSTELRFISPEVGYGVFATTFIPSGTITYVKDSLELEISPVDYLLHSAPMRETIEKYSYIDERGYRIVSWDFAKYVNHCCQCNTISTGYGFEIAIRDIQAGEQITDEYGIFNLEQEIALVCGEKVCRRCVRPEDFDRYYQEWDQKILQAMPLLFMVDQPLQPLLSPEIMHQLQEYRQDPGRYVSVYNLKYRAKNHLPAPDARRIKA